MAVSFVSGLISAAGATIATGWTTFNAFMVTTLQFTALSAVSRALSPKPNFDAMTGVNFNVREPAASRKIIYGQSRIGGAVVYLASTGDSNEYLHLVIAVAGHEIESYEEIYFNDEKVWDSGSYQSDWADFARLKLYKGDQTTADSDLVSEVTQWTTDHKLLDTAYIYARIKYDAEKFTQGVPNISCIVKGKKVYDPRTTTTAYSNNAALCLYDYMRDAKYGLGESASAFDQSAITTAANLCDENVSLDGGGTQKRYTCDGVLDSATSLKGNIENILTGMVGTLQYANGLFHINAYGYSTPVSTVVDESMIVSSMQITTKTSRRNLYNAVKGRFVSEEENYTVADYPAQISTAYATADGETVHLDVTLPTTTNNIRAQRLARLTMLKSRLQMSIKMQLNLEGMKFKVGDNIKVTNSRLGITEQVFEINSFQLLPSADNGLIVEIEATENASSAYVWNTSDELDFTAGASVDLYDAKTLVAPTGLTVTPESQVQDDGTINNVINVSWTAPQDVFKNYYEVKYGVVGTSTLIGKSTVAEDYVITNLKPNTTYNVKVRAFNLRGVRSDFVTAQVTTASDFMPKLPSVYRISKNNASAPTTAEFSTAASRDPKEKDIVITTDTSTSPHSTHAWSYSTSTSSWVQDDNLLTGDLIIDGTIATANIADAAITNAKIDSLSADKITAGTIDASSITVTNLDADNITAGDLSADRLQIDGVTLDTDGSGNLIIKNGGVGTTQISAASITTAKIVNDAVTNALIATDAVNQDSIAANAVTATEIVSGTITATEIAASTITGAQIAADTIAVSKLTGDVSEVYPIMIYENQTLTTTAHNSPVFTLHAPDLVSKKPKISLRFDYTVGNGTSTNRVQLISANIQIKSKGGSAVQIGASSGVTVSQSSSLASTIYLSGDHTGSMDYVGSVADNSSGTDAAVITGLYYDDANDRTYISMSHSSPPFQTGETLYYHPFRWLSAGIWYSMVSKEQISIYSPGYTTVKAHEYIDLMFTSTSTKTDFRLQVNAPTTYTTVTPKFVRLTGTMELIS